VNLCGGGTTDFHPRMEALTGTPEQVGRAAKHYRVYFSDVDREEDDDDYVGTSLRARVVLLGYTKPLPV